MKGFTKGKGKGKKFIPTSRKKLALSSKDIKKNTRHEDSIPFEAITQFATDKAHNQMINLGNKIGDKIGNPLFGESVKEAGKSLPKSTLNFIVKATGETIKKAKEAQKDKSKKQKEIKVDQERIEIINENVIDDIIDNRQTTNEQKFRFLQRYAVENNQSLTDKQRLFINNTLKKLEQEANTPTTFLGQTTSSSSRSSTSKNKRSATTSTASTDNFTMPSNTAPIKLQNGTLVVQTNEELALNQTPRNRISPVSVSQPVTTTTTTTSPSSPAFSNLSDNLNAEIGAVLG